MTDAPTTNAQAYSVSELAFALKRTLEDAYGFVRLRGELSKVTHHSSGHVYLTLKDDKAALDGVVWKGSVKNLSIRPEQGMEVIVTGRITTFPAGSRYQIVIETMEAAGIGALLAQLERLKAKLADEGLFRPERKRPIPAMPAVVGVITSPTGAVIRDILHRIRDRWPCRVVVWPVVVQGDAAAGQVAAAIKAFNALEAGGAIPRPDVLIVARGGGSVEDLWPFNDETLARTVAAGTIPLISAVGHETDTTLIDFVSDRRAPTPTAAAEMATPVLAELRAALAGLDQRLVRCSGRLIEDRRTRLAASARGLPRPADLTAAAGQRLDYAASHLAAGLRRNLDLHARQLAETASPLRPTLLQRRADLGRQSLETLGRRLDAAMKRASDTTELTRRLEDAARRMGSCLRKAVSDRGQRLVSLDAERRLKNSMGKAIQDSARRLESLNKLRLSLDPKRPLRMGFALVTRPDGSIVRHGVGLEAGETVGLMFEDVTRQAVIDGETGRAAPKPVAKKAATPSSQQGDLF
ncbi:exodeoxyribonuclease VII large subunit [Caulobacter sp. SLTY]|uniref:exodeoxyribonuclease VII large subunit n=1 Tax=Caulobacter sp. SLTY TaxID=2683262 RepID=UPI001412FD48|nr:exodeoxyribonuclease VII large subunit [Caulobacter sp. SLTY]